MLLHLYPRSSIRVYLSVTSEDGSLFSTCVNAISLALIDAGIALLEPLCAVTVGLYAGGGGSGAGPGAGGTNDGGNSSTEDADADSPGGTLLLDLSGTEEASLPSLTLGIMPRAGKVSLLELETRLHLDRLREALRLGVQAAAVVKAEMDAVVKMRTRRLARALGGQGVGANGDGGEGEEEEDAYGLAAGDDDMEEDRVGGGR